MKLAINGVGKYRFSPTGDSEWRSAFLSMPVIYG